MRKLRCKPMNTAIDPKNKLNNVEESKPIDVHTYQRLVGKLIYLSHTCPDISYAVSTLSQFIHCSKEIYLFPIEIKNNNKLDVEVYINTDYARCIMDRCSTSGYCTFLNEILITWHSKK
ncbi:unnamed protein product [Spirodela intermedia]|uniref:Uncharacterized protein n=2 Tax=Spirodela intermedia TaxID=51605 RepID=A0A7I8IBG8_SPIIN|nr:unnamed protein product [Spirodela intermedia]CAA6654684.1 unnamed protein product [Spirodela intermedia]CAA7389340.1 unnamed protein product [Spirodela intermedia]